MSSQTAKNYLKNYSTLNKKISLKKTTGLEVKISNTLPVPLKYKLYCDAVQTPPESVAALDYVYNLNFNKKALTLREDFCGTFLVGCEWAKSAPDRKAIGIDLGQEPLRIAKENITTRLKPSDRKRAITFCQDVRVPTIPRVDMITAENFSFYIFKKRSDLLDYFRSAYSSLNRNGLLNLDMIGGPKFIETPLQNVRTLKAKDIGLPSSVTYRWRQTQFNAITNEAIYHIDFKIKDDWYKEVFTYDWRIWTIPEVIETLKEAGFDDVIVYWNEEKSETLSLKPISKITSEWETWMCTVAGIKGK